eukprot:12031544-Alexandrium_andersonii.AAC.1
MKRVEKCWKAPAIARNGLQQAPRGRFGCFSSLSSAVRSFPTLLFCRTAPETAWSGLLPSEGR